MGIVVSTLVGASEALSWRWSIGLAAVPAAVLLLIVLRLPESPRWLVGAHRADDARSVLERVRPSETDVSDELEEMADTVRAERSESEGRRGWSGLRQAWVRPALLVGCGVALFTQLSGIEMIIYCAPTILTDNGFSRSAALDVSVALGVACLVMMLVGLAAVDRVDRRRLTLVMVPGAALALVALGIVFIVSGDDVRGSIPFVVACLVVFMLFNAGGLQLMGWLTGSEVYPLAVRAAGTSAQAAVLWTTNLVITLTTLSVITGIGPGPTMLVYAAFNAAAWIFVWKKVPELTGRSLESIESHLREGRFAPADFRPRR